MPEPTSPVRQPFFDDVPLGDTIPTRRFGPLTIGDTVAWAGVQENPERLHWDREFARELGGMPTFIASGAYRQALLLRCLSDWIGPAGALVRLSLRHTHPTHEGDRMEFSGRVVEKSPSNQDPWLTMELKGQNQDGREILRGQCTVRLPTRDGRSQ